jgi:hypothetical protein
MHDKDRDIGGRLGCCAVSADAEHSVGSTLANGRTCSHMLPSKALELRILQLYIWSLDAKRFIDGNRTATIARYGAYEVRLVEPLLDPQGDIIPFWIELFDHKSGATIDSCGGRDFEESAVGAGALISQASLLHCDAISRQQDVAKHCRWPLAN